MIHEQNAGITLAGLSLLLLVTLGCTTDPIDDSDPVFRYPLSVGNQWIYQQQGQRKSVESDSTFDQRTGIDTVTVTGTEIWNTANVIKIEQNYHDSHNEFIRSAHWYENRADGLFAVGNQNAIGGVAQPAPGRDPSSYGKSDFNRLNSSLHFVLGSLGTFNSNSDSIHRFDPPHKILLYPMAVGVRWMMFRESASLRLDKSVTCRETITTPAGTFDCFVIRQYWDFEDDGSFDSTLYLDDWVSDKGLVKRRFWGLFEMRNDLNKPVGVSELEITYELASYRLME